MKTIEIFGILLKKGGYEMERKEKVFRVILIVLSIILFSYAGYSMLTSTEPEQIITWSTEGDYCFAVGVSYDGDTFEPGIYHFYNERLSDLSKVAAWEIYASKTPLNNRSQLKESKSVAIVGGAEDLEYTVDISQGNYIYIKYRGDKEKTDANSLVVDWTPSETN